MLTDFLRGLQSCIFSSHMNFWKKNVFPKNILSFINIFWNWVKNCWPSAKRTSIGLTKLGSTCPKEHSESKKIVIENVQFSKHVRTSNEKIFSFFRKNFGGFVKTVFLISVGTFRRKNFSRKKNDFLLSFILFGHWIKIYWPSTKKTSMGLSNPQVTCLWDQCRERKIFERIIVFLSHFDFELKSVNFLSSNFLRVPQSCILQFHKNTSKKNRFCKTCKFK